MVILAPHGEVARITIEEVILNLNMWGEEERKRTILASSKKRADIIYPLKWKYIVLVLNKLVCVMFFFFKLLVRIFKAKYSKILLLTTTLLFFFMKKIFIFEIPVRRKMLGVSQAINIWIIQP